MYKDTSLNSSTVSEPTPQQQTQLTSTSYFDWVSFVLLKNQSRIQMILIFPFFKLKANNRIYKISFKSWHCNHMFNVLGEMFYSKIHYKWVLKQILLQNNCNFLNFYINKKKPLLRLILRFRLLLKGLNFKGMGQLFAY